MKSASWSKVRPVHTPMYVDASQKSLDTSGMKRTPLMVLRGISVPSADTCGRNVSRSAVCAPVEPTGAKKTEFASLGRSFSYRFGVRRKPRPAVVA